MGTVKFFDAQKAPCNREGARIRSDRANTGIACGGSRLTWRTVDLDTGEVAFSTRKTGRRIVLPLVQPLADYLSSLPASDNPNAFIFPHAASAKRTTSLSNQFRDILVEAGLVEPLPRGH